ncbi:zinc finger BED domain-containing protein RICESLEEPER 4-like [Miscanthus floridulus]|uniref:zinc finger BED domain-containing protein RICESLEEPER 4-like n=1 Tax=Miscanthus floridulus TaxID=154761 RepID=UPI00345904F1
MPTVARAIRTDVADADGGQSEVSPIGSNRPSTSAVWEDFEKHYKTEKGRKIRFAATCLHCHKRCFAYSAHGTRHLTRHLTKCPKKLEKTRGMTQTHIAFNSDGSVRRWEYSAEVARVELVRMLARLGLPLMIGETETFKDYIKTAHNPNFSPVSKQTTGRDLFKYYNEKRDKLMRKKVLGLRLIDVSYNAENIAELVASVLAEYGILNKVFSVTLDNASANKNAMDKLKPILKEYLGSDLYQHDEHLRSVIQPIIDKYNKYWKNIPDLYSIAFILDPRAKIKGFTKVLRKLHSLFNIDYTNKLLDTRALLFKMYNRYDVMYGSNRLKRVVPPSLFGKKRTAWAKIYDDEELDVGAGCSSLPSSLDHSRSVSTTSLLQAATASSNSSELASYLNCNIVSQLDDEFDIMQWWHEHKLTYSILSVLAKDILTVPVSTISSESTFSLTGRIIEERRRRLNPETVEALTCIKDWENAETRLQHMVEDKELEEAFAGLYLYVN